MFSCLTNCYKLNLEQFFQPEAALYFKIQATGKIKEQEILEIHFQCKLINMINCLIFGEGKCCIEIIDVETT